MLSPKQIVDKMMVNDAMSHWLGINIVSVEPGKAILKMTVKPEMLNGFSIAHGGITYALSDSCIAFSANTHGQHAVSVETSISHLYPVKNQDVLRTEVTEVSRSKRFGIYTVSIFNQNDKMVSIFKGTMYIKPEVWD